LLVWLFGPGFSSALYPTRMLLITALLECLNQLIVQPLLAAGQTRVYGFWQNLAAILAAFLGWLWIPAAGLAAYLIVRLLYVLIPLIGFSVRVVQKFQEPKKLLALTLLSIGLMALFLAQLLNGFAYSSMTSLFVIAFIMIIVSQRDDLLLLKQALMRDRD